MSILVCFNKKEDKLNLDQRRIYSLKEEISIVNAKKGLLLCYSNIEMKLNFSIDKLFLIFKGKANKVIVNNGCIGINAEIIYSDEVFSLIRLHKENENKNSLETTILFSVDHTYTKEFFIKNSDKFTFYWHTYHEYILNQIKATPNSNVREYIENNEQIPLQVDGIMQSLILCTKKISVLRTDYEYFQSDVNSENLIFGIKCRYCKKFKRPNGCISYDFGGVKNAQNYNVSNIYSWLFCMGEIKESFYNKLNNKNRDYVLQYIYDRLFENEKYKSLCLAWKEKEFIEAINVIVLGDNDFCDKITKIQSIIADNKELKGLYKKSNRNENDIKQLNRLLIELLYPDDIVMNRNGLVKLSDSYRCNKVDFENDYSFFHPRKDILVFLGIVLAIISFIFSLFSINVNNISSLLHFKK